MSTAKEFALFNNILGAFKELDYQVIRSGASFMVLSVLKINVLLKKKPFFK